MNIKWFDTKTKEGMASLYSTSILLNTVASMPFELAYNVQIGVDEENRNIIIKPLSKERVIRGDLDEYTLQKISVTKTYSRVASTSIMKKIADEFNLTLSDSPIKFPTVWDDVENVLIVKVGGNK